MPFLGEWEIGTLGNAVDLCGSRVTFNKALYFNVYLSRYAIRAIKSLHGPALRNACKYSISPYTTTFLVHDSFALGENDFMHHLYSTTHLYSLQPLLILRYLRVS